MYRPVLPRHPLAPVFARLLRGVAAGVRTARGLGSFPVSVLAVAAALAVALLMPDAEASETAKPVDKPAEKVAEKPAEKPVEKASDKAAAKEAATELVKDAKPVPAEALPGVRTSSPEAMDRLREKLAERLGAVRSPASKSPYDLQVAGKNPNPGAERPIAARAGGKAARPAEAAAKADHAATHTGPWAYNGPEGPEAWAQLKPEYAACGSGQRQSPIDIRDGFQVQLPAIEFDYRPTAFSVIDNGRTVQVNLQPGNGLTLNGRRYELLQFHFHRPSEERINGKVFDMVVHLEHKDAEGKLATVAVLLERGSAQPVVQAVWNALPLEKGEDVPAPGLIDIGQLLPKDTRYYTYMGSMTTPPCSEGVLWMVMKQPVQLSPEQLNIFSRLYPMNARPVQPAAGRMIKESS